MTPRPDAAQLLLQQVSTEKPLLVFFLRHSGCTFCKETLAILSQRQSELKAKDFDIAVVMMSSPESIQEICKRYNLNDIYQISDPQRVLYQAFGLKRGSFTQLFGFKIWRRGLEAFFKGGHGIGALDGDGFQMGGAFLVHQKQILISVIAQDASEKINLDLLLAHRANLKYSPD